jgi:hypothetical protein
MTTVKYNDTYFDKGNVEVCVVIDKDSACSSFVTRETSMMQSVQLSPLAGRTAASTFVV